MAMTLPQQVQVLADELRLAVSHEQPNNTCLFTSADPERTLQKLNESGIAFEKETSNQFSFLLNNPINEVHLFLNEEKFRQRAESLFNDNFNLSTHIGILNYNSNSFFYDYVSKKSFSNSIPFSNFLIDNTVGYLKLIKGFKKESFADYVNLERNEMVIYSASKGILKIELPNYPISFNPDRSILLDCELLIQKLSNSDFTIHFKNQLFGITKEQGVSPVESFFLHIKTLIQEADNNYQLQLKNFSFDKFKTDLQKEKEKYFTSLREILNKILAQVVGVPVSIAASAYATYKVESNFVFFLITTALMIYVCFALYFQYLYFVDLNEIETDFKRDFAKVKKDSGLTALDFEEKKIDQRIHSIRRTVYVYCSMIILLFLTFVLFMSNQLTGCFVSKWIKETFIQIVDSFIYTFKV